MTTALPSAATISRALLSSTQAQWSRADYLGMPGVERNVGIVSQGKGLLVWYARFRNERTGSFIGHKYFVAIPKTNEIVAVFDTIEEKQAWLKAA